MRLPVPQHSLREYIALYQEGHTKLGTKLTHMVGIPMIVAAFPTAPVSPPLAGALFVGGWALQLVGHSVFEKNKPAFLADPYYLLVGPVWVAVEWLELLGVEVPEFLQPAKAEAGAEPEAAHVATNGASEATSAS